MCGHWTKTSPEKILNKALMERYFSIVCKKFKKVHNQKVNEISICQVDDDVVRNKVTILFRHRLGMKGTKIIDFT